MERVAKLATPALAVAVVVPERMPPAGLVPMATVMLALDVVTVLPKASCTDTWTVGATAVPAVALEGWAGKAPLAARGGGRLEGVEGALVSPPEAAGGGEPVAAFSQEGFAQ